MADLFALGIAVHDIQRHGIEIEPMPSGQWRVHGIVINPNMVVSYAKELGALRITHRPDPPAPPGEEGETRIGRALKILHRTGFNPQMVREGRWRVGMVEFSGPGLIQLARERGGLRR